MPGGRAPRWSLAAALLFGAAVLVLAVSLATSSSASLVPVSAGIGALAVLVFLGGKLAAPPRRAPPMLADR
ncbi:MAG TPA: hypothetical protein VKS03_09870, partial [Thermoanaerobaculia bacterium]|nr:hypothetical protein [Thermoanaerobaculia bacterium]